MFLPLLPLNPVFPVSVPPVKMLWSVNNDPLLFTLEFRNIKQENQDNSTVSGSKKSQSLTILTVLS